MTRSAAPISGGIEPASCRPTTARACPASRSASLSPTQITAMSPARRRRLGADRLVAFAMIAAPLRVADDDVAAPGILQHLGAEIAGMRALRRRMAILAAEQDVRSGDRFAKNCEQG